MSESYADILFGKQDKPQPVVIDRSSVERYAVCPMQGYLCGQQQYRADSKLADTGTIIHELIREAIENCREDLSMVADYFCNELPRVRPDVQPEALRAGQFVADELSRINYTSILLCEQQIDFPPRSEDGTVDNCPAWLLSPKGVPMVWTTKPDLVMSGNRNSLVVYDWKTGFKRRTNEEAYDEFQTAFIAFLLWQLYPDVEDIHFFYKETRWGHSAYAQLARSKEHRTLPHLTTEAAFQARILAACQYWFMESKDTWPIYEKCILCPVTKQCPNANADAIELAHDPRLFVDRMTTLQALLDQMDETAKTWVKANGAIEGTASIYDFIPPAPKFMPKLRAKEMTESEIIKPKRSKKCSTPSSN